MNRNRDYMTVIEAAQFVGVTAGAVYAKLPALKAVSVFGKLVIPRVNVEAWKRNRTRRLTEELNRSKR